MTVMEIYQKVASGELTPEEGARLLTPPRRWHDNLFQRVSYAACVVLLIWEIFR